MDAKMQRTVMVFVRPDHHSPLWRRGTLCEKLFGIIPGRLDDQSPGGRIIVHGLLPDGEAVKCGIHLGDCLLAVNKVDVTFDNIDAVLHTISSPQKVVLTVQKLCLGPSETTDNAASARATTLEKDGLVKLLAGDRLSRIIMSLDDVPHAAMYLTMDVESEKMQDKEDVIYCFPSCTGKLFDVRGAFITLCHLMPQISKSEIKNTTIAIDNRVVHVAYHRCGSELFLFCAPGDKLHKSRLTTATLDIVRILEFVFGSVMSAFKHVENHPFLNQFFALTFQRLLLADELISHGARQSKFVEPFFEILPGVRAVVLSEDTKVAINNSLSDYEAADFADMGYLLASHLPKEDLLDVALYLRYQCLLTMCSDKRLGHLIVWREIFPTRRFHDVQGSAAPSYCEPDGRWFLMVVAMQNALLAVELEAGGCASAADGFPDPDPFYIDQAKATLVHLDRLGVFTRCSNRIDGPSIPNLACADWFLPTNAQKKGKPPGFTVSFLPSTSKKVIKPDSVLTKRDASPVGGSMTDLNLARPGLQRVLSWDPGLVDEDDYQSTVTSAGSFGTDRKLGVEDFTTTGSSRLFKGDRKHRSLLTMFDLADLKRDSDENRGENGTAANLTSGCDNTLFHYVHFDGLQGIFICPTQQELQQNQSPLTDHILKSFHNACLSIHQLFQKYKCTTVDSSTSNNKTCINEHGMLFSCPVPDWNDSKKPAPTVSYWVVGRQFYSESGVQEFYVCFHDSAQQNVIEMAFKLVQGTLI